MGEPRPATDHGDETVLLSASKQAVGLPDLSAFTTDGPTERLTPAQDFAAPLDGSGRLYELGRYVVMGTLGRGGMGTVFDAFDPTLNRRVALKVLHEEVDQEHTTRLVREAQALARLSHPNVVQVYEVGEVAGRTFVAMERVEGQTLRQWMRREPRPGWRECIEIFAQVGAGLAAAHEQGLVHRDFKPSNAIIDDKGRARVLDFGLARQGGVVDDAMSTNPRTPTPPIEPLPLEVPLTSTGVILGTPAYMPLEQMCRRQVDARSDQFSFCVALFEAVYGERPFEGNTTMALLVSMAHDEVRPPSQGAKIPAALRTALLRGLAMRPEDRWPDMEALLAELHSQLVARRRPWLAAGLAGGLVAIGAGLGIDRYAEWASRCTGARPQLAGIWDDTRRQEVQDAIVGTERSYAPGTWERVEQRLDAYTDDWVNKHTEVCETARVRQEQTEEQMALRMGCLRTRKTAVRAAVGVLSDADAQVVQNAIHVVTGLPSLARCDDLDALQATVPPPEDPQVAQQVEALGERLAELETMDRAGRFVDAVEHIEPVVRRAKALGYVPLLAETMLRRGQLRSRTGDYDEAESDLKQAYRLALEHELDEVELDAAQYLATVVGAFQQRHEDGLEWSETARALAKRSGDELRLVKSSSIQGNMFLLRADYDQAKRHYQQVLRISEQLQGADHPNVAQSSSNLGVLLYRQGDYEQAERHLERALQIWEKALGPDHPDVAQSVNNLGIVSYGQGDYEQAKRYHRRALQIWEEALGPDHPNVGASLDNLGNLSYSQEDYEQAERCYRRALRIREKALAADHPDVAASLNNLGNVFYFGQGDYEQAKRHYQRAMRIWEKTLGPDHPNVATSSSNLGNVFDRQGNYEQAVRHLERASRIWEQALGPDHPDLAIALVNLGALAFKRRHYEDAERHHQRALRIREKALAADHPDVASSLSSLGALYAEQGDHERAKPLLERALRIQRGALGVDHSNVADSSVDLANVLLAEQQFDTARTHAERAVAIRASSNTPPTELAEARFMLARALWPDLSERARARGLAEQARDVFAEHGESSEDDLAETERWLVQHRVR